MLITVSRKFPKHVIYQQSTDVSRPSLEITTLKLIQTRQQKSRVSLSLPRWFCTFLSWNRDIGYGHHL